MRFLDRLARGLHRHLVVVLSCTYGLAVLLPSWGQRIRWAQLGTLQVGHLSLPIPVPTVLLAILLCSASMGIDARQVQQVRRHPSVLLAGLLANLMLPLGFLACCTLFLTYWPAPLEVRSLLLGLAILGAMPIAGSSTAWAQQAHGNLALSLSLVLCSTFMSPLVTPLCFVAMSWVTSHLYDTELALFSGGQTRLFLLVAVLFPCLLGLILHALLGKKRVAWFSPALRLGSMISLLTLNYANAAVALPHLVQSPNWGFVGLAGGLAMTLCSLRYAGGYLLGRWMRAPAADTTSMVYGMGMNNNGSALVLASQQMPNDSNLLLLMVLYTILQQIGAGTVQLLLRGARRRRRQQLDLAAAGVV
jgi:BASS family bile acid:Na+ symporter